MSDYLAARNNITADFDVDLEVITPDVEKLAFSASGKVDVARPDKIRVSRAGGYSDVEIVYDGKTVTILDRANNRYSQAAAHGAIDGFADHMRSQFNVEIPAMDLFLSNSFAVLSDGVLHAKYIGPSMINGVECNHLAFRNADTDWQLWVRPAPNPVPCKYVITSKLTAGAPQYRITFRNFSVEKGQPVSYAFNAPSGAKRVPFDQLSGVGELPPLAPGGK